MYDPYGTWDISLTLFRLWQEKATKEDKETD